jgi:hypothetical protein
MAEEFDDELAASFVGKHILVGITYLDHAEEPVEQKQLHGRIVRIDPPRRRGDRGERFGRGAQAAARSQLIRSRCPSKYRLRSTGEVVVDPDLTCTWVMKKPRH